MSCAQHLNEQYSIHQQEVLRGMALHKKTLCDLAYHWFLGKPPHPRFNPPGPVVDRSLRQKIEALLNYSLEAGSLPSVDHGNVTFSQAIVNTIMFELIFPQDAKLKVNTMTMALENWNPEKIPVKSMIEEWRKNSSRVYAAWFDSRAYDCVRFSQMPYEDLVDGTSKHRRERNHKQ